MKTAIDALLEVSVYAAVIAAAIFLFRLLLQKSVSPRLQYLVWILLVARLLLPVTFESGFHMESLFPKNIETPAVVAVTVPETEAALEVQTHPENTAPSAPSATAETVGEGTVKKTSADPYALAAAVWVSGIAAFALWMLVVKRRFFRRMELARVETPEVVAAMYEKCRAETGVKRKMPLWVVDAAISPGIAFFNGPMLLLPASVIDREETLRFSLLHELTHQKRGDPFIGVLLNVLRAVYWFHPVVHIAFSQMRSDMEIACDCDVTCFLGPSEKKGYLTAILELFSYEAEPQLGMAQFRTRRMARRRMKGAFMKTKASFTTKLAAGLLCLVLVTACFTTACQSAPPETGAPVSTIEPARNASVTPPPAAPPAEKLSATGDMYPDAALRGSFTIENDGGEAQKANMVRASELINTGGGMVLQPGEEWSFLSFFNLPDDGWNRSPGIMDGRYVEGGEPDGLCTVSTAIYNAVLNAELEVTERSHHSWWQVYAAPGLDAAVSQGVDFKFKNNTSEPVVLTSALEEGKWPGRLTFTVTVCGEPLENGASHSLRSETVATEKPGETIYRDDPTMPVGMTEYAAGARDGMTAEVYRDTFVNGVLTKSELLYTDTYHAVTEVVLRGTKTPHLITDMTDDELKTLAKTLYVSYVYRSGENNFEAISVHYGALFKLLDIHFGGIMGGGDDREVSFTIGVPMQAFDVDKCWPYAAVIFALDPDAAMMNIGSMEYHTDGTDALSSLSREDVQKHYGAVLEKPLLNYAKSGEDLFYLLKTVAHFN